MSDSNDLEGKVALVTGASSGIGEATALALAARGAKVAIAARRRERLEKLAEDVRAQGGEALPLVTDAAKETDLRAMVDGVEKRFGRLDMLVNNAGVMLLAPIADASHDDWRRMLELNVLAVMIGTQHALPMLKRARGHVVNIASVAGRVANPDASGYAASKFGVVAFTESLRREVFKDGVRVTVIEPGIVATELGEHITHAGMKAGLAQRIAAIDPLQAADIAAAVVYAVTQPPRVNVNEILLRPTAQER
jgi:NADP-dependent 3-hydroxy acid dehydrogenase YdfG